MEQEGACAVVLRADVMGVSLQFNEEKYVVSVAAYPTA